ncbi:hypothetical protein CR513_42479, partial [Mucuna pruriens]
MDRCKIAIVLTICIMAALIFAHCCVAENVAEDVAAIPPTPMEGSGVHLCAPAVFVAIAFVWVDFCGNRVGIWKFIHLISLSQKAAPKEKKSLQCNFFFMSFQGNQFTDLQSSPKLRNHRCLMEPKRSWYERLGASGRDTISTTL